MVVSVSPFKSFTGPGVPQDLTQLTLGGALETFYFVTQIFQQHVSPQASYGVARGKLMSR